MGGERKTDKENRGKSGKYSGLGRKGEDRAGQDRWIGDGWAAKLVGQTST